MPDAAAPPPSLHKPRRRRLSREEKARLTRGSLLNAGCAVVAAEGYAAAAVAKIADQAGVAHGTFYNYFEDRQALFDELLPYEGLRMREAVERVARKVPSGMEREIVRFEAFLNYVIENDGFYRILYESEIFAPRAHSAHMANIVEGYRRTFGRAMREGWMRALDARQVDCLIYQLLGIRAYSAMQIHYAPDMAARCAIRDAAVETYRLLTGASLKASLEAGA
ncbi:MAG: TetR/AcrR family transcriptional regulator [Aquamicrobium sp.]|uniref:TetR/AcrR family transcriptional regulator n=1 Tax=Aquamicrobium sp. TaxID=1872579 RepID=UPI00349E96FE|nr:TetR/AcrR family transcriptional regulator [Aquamicrobium sp.]